MPTFEYEIVIPAYNAGKSLQTLLTQIKELPHKPATIRVIDDGSTDNTSNIALSNEVQLVSIPQNKGKGFALKTGFLEFLNQSKSEYLLCMDADLQHPVNSIPDFLKSVYENHHNIVIGKRDWNIRNMPATRILSNTLSSKILSKKTGQNIQDSQCGFRMIHRSVLDKIELAEDGFQMETEFILKSSIAGFKMHFISIPTIYNKYRSNIKHFNDTFKFFKIILGN
jgi:glycosyltransferase involved in cell wall biosynthesis